MCMYLSLLNKKGFNEELKYSAELGLDNSNFLTV